MELLRTPTERFEDLLSYPFEPNYFQINENGLSLRLHYVDEGTKDADPVLLMHGEPTWSFLYRHMIPILTKAECRVIVPDLIGFGKSDKLTQIKAHTYRKHVKWITKFVETLDLKRISMFCQNWGSLIGLRVAAENSERFHRIVLSNGGLPTGAEKMTKAFINWRETARTIGHFPVGQIVQAGTVSELSDDVIAGYDAPFPEEKYKAGARALPSLVPTSTEDPEHEANKKAIERFRNWRKPFLTAFSDSDPITRGGDQLFQKIVPGARGQAHKTIRDAGHFVQEDQGPECAKTIINFIEDNPM
ncbi:MAG: haloalkane dehalogenase [Candidatus Bathyarchaeota archaeon]|nr:MAG: haloalkane dehalogenase [Candidatus Bathyarchaeota archaeon]